MLLLRSAPKHRWHCDPNDAMTAAWSEAAIVWVTCVSFYGAGVLAFFKTCMPQGGTTARPGHH